MVPCQRLRAPLTPLQDALACLLRGLEPVAPVELPLAEALGCIAAEMLPLTMQPAHDIAASDGWALRANDLVGASSYSPLLLSQPPTWIEAGDVMPAGCDCVLDADVVELAGPVAQAVTEAIPGQGVRRTGQDIAGGSSIAEPGRRVLVRDLLMARVAKVERLSVRRPRLHIVNVPAETATANLIAESARCAGADVISTEAGTREAASIAAAFEAAASDLLITVGGSGVGHTDAAVTALATRGDITAHGIALQPGRTSAVGSVGSMPVIALPGAPDQAFAAWWALAVPVLDRLAGRRPRETLSLPLSRKIASSVGIAEFVVLARQSGAWMPLASGELSFDAIARAEAFLLVPAGSEGFAAGTRLDAYMLSE
jgi:molybdopterin molybdotransferase